MRTSQHARISLLSRPPKWTSPPSGDSPPEACFKWKEALRGCILRRKKYYLAPSFENTLFRIVGGKEITGVENTLFRIVGRKEITGVYAIGRVITRLYVICSICVREWYKNHGGIRHWQGDHAFVRHLLDAYTNNAKILISVLLYTDLAPISWCYT